MAAMPPSAEPLRLGLLSDVHHAEKEAHEERVYLRALDHLEEVLSRLKVLRPALLLQLGDLIDGREELVDSRADLERALEVLSTAPCPVHHLIGNHCLAVPRAELETRLGLRHSRYTLVHEPWRLVVLDTMAISACGADLDDPGRARAERWLAEHSPGEHANAETWNGALGEEQVRWLQAELLAAGRAGQRAIVFGHNPVKVEASSPEYLAWDAEPVAAMLGDSRAAVAYCAGHDHDGGYACSGGVHHLTLPAVLEEPRAALLELHPDRLLLFGIGAVSDRELILS